MHPVKHANPSEKKESRSVDLEILRMLIPYLGAWRGRASLAVVFLLAAKVATVSVPLFLKQIIDRLEVSSTETAALPLGMLLAYGAARLTSSLFRELQTWVFSKVETGIVREISMRVVRHLHDLSLRFHLERKTGELSRDIGRGTSSVSTLLTYLLFNILPTLVEVGMVGAILYANYHWAFSMIMLVTVVLYAVFTFSIAQWRMKFRAEMNSRDSDASSKAMDGLLNYETVKYFGNEEYEIRRYGESLASWRESALQVQSSLAFLNAGQNAIIGAGVTLAMILAAKLVTRGEMSLGDLVAINAFVIQLFLPLGFLGTVYSMLKQAALDMERMFGLLDRKSEVNNVDGAKELEVSGGEVVFENVDFGYDANRQILHSVNLRIPAGKKIAIVGASGSGKSTLARLLFRFFDVQSGSIRIDGQDLREISQQSLRAAIGIVPQDTVLFNDTLEFNLAYGRLGATPEEIQNAIQLAQLSEFVRALPDGLQTKVGERGLKLSGGEKQRVAIARALLKAPPILIFDEATSSLDSESEQAILESLRQLAGSRTTLVIAHRLSTIVDADEIVVLGAGRVLERGSHHELLRAGGAYSNLWKLQQDEGAARMHTESSQG